MNVLYQPKGRAREYSNWALNVYNGCSHGCVYCYVPPIFKKDPELFRKQVYPRKNVVKLLKEDLEEFVVTKMQPWEVEDEDPTVLLSFACDPYQPIEEELKITQKCLELFVQFDVPVQILTQGCKLAVRDFDLLAHNPNNKYAVTMTHTDDEVLSRIEPGASSYQVRVSSLRLAKELGITTWVSLEPVVNFDETYKIIKDTHEFVDQYKVGKLNHDPFADKLNWSKFKKEVVELLESLGKDYYLKEDLRKF